MNELMVALYSGKYNLNATNIRLILCIWYNNDYGERQGVELSLKTLASEVNGEFRNVHRELSKLFGMNIIRVVEDYSLEEQYGRWLMVNPVNEWRIK